MRASSRSARRPVPVGRHLVAAVVVSASLVACTGSAAPGEPPPDPPAAAPDADQDTAPSRGTLRIGLADDPRSIDPRFVADEEGELVVGAVFEPLVRLVERDRLVAGAARTWEVDEEGRRFTFTLREATFHDGSPVTARDVVRTFSRIADGTAEPRSPLVHLVEPIVGSARADREGGRLRGVRALDDRTVQIELQEPDPRYLLTLADPALAPTPAAADEAPAAFAVQPIGNGPFRMAEPREVGAFVRLTRVADHHRAPRVDEVVFQVYPDDPDRERQWRDLNEGLLQVADLGPDRLEEARASFGTSADGQRGPGVLDAPTSTVALLAFDVSRPPFDDPVVRRAISQSIDRDAIADELLGGTWAAADSLVPPGIPGARPGVCDHCRFDPEGAVALLEDAEVVLPPVLTLTTNRGTTHTAVANRVASDVRAALGAIVRVVPLDLPEFAGEVATGETRWFRLGWDANEPDPGAYLTPLFASGSPDNVSRFLDEEVDELLAAARAEPDAAASADLYGEVERRLLDDAVVIPLLVDRRMRVVTNDVRGLEFSPAGRVDLARVTLGDGR
ncbi:ABC transporter substrate-binding protein [Nitriliruptoraceae bacterium ZYF776]|nr:ABC transporter substrate-binding protein [Profundirhabdus halotolerans]